MSTNGNIISKNKKTTIFFVALAVFIIALIGMMWYHKFGPFSRKSDRLATAQNSFKDPASTVNAIRSKIKTKTGFKNIASFDNGIDKDANAVASLFDKNYVTKENFKKTARYTFRSSKSDSESNTSNSDKMENSIDNTSLSRPLCLTEFDFEKNTGIKNRKAYNAFTKFESLTLKEDMDYETYNASKKTKNHPMLCLATLRTSELFT